MENRETISMSGDTFSNNNEIEQKELLKGKRITLRPLKESDAEFIQKWHTDPKNLEFYSNSSAEKFKGESYIKQATGEMAKEDFFIIETNESHPIGFCGLEEGEDQNVHFGIMIGEENYRDKGYSKEAAALLIKHGFEKMGIDYIYTTTHERNEVSKNLLKSVGFKEQEKFGGQEEDIKQDGKTFKRLYYKLSKDDWNKRNI